MVFFILNYFKFHILKEEATSSVVQSKPVLLTLKNKAMKQISPLVETDDKYLISRQCFCLYSNNTNSRSSSNQRSFPSNTISLICAQKLMSSQNGRLLITFKEDTNFLTQIFNCLDKDIYLWSRISSNFILENYVKNTEAINESESAEMKRELFRQKIGKTFK